MNNDPELLQQIRAKAYQLLSQRDYSRQNLFYKLYNKFPNQLACEQIIAECIQKGFINEQRFIESFIHTQKNKGFGPLRIINALKMRGLDEELIAEHINIADNNWSILATRLVEKFCRGNLILNYQSKAKLMRLLLSRGFTQTQIQCALKIKMNTTINAFDELDMNE